MSSRKKAFVVFGTRPEAIKLAPVIQRLREHEGFETVICVTAQHREMLDQMLRVFELQPNYDLDVMTPGQTLSQVTTEVLNGVGKILDQEAADVVIVQGDTTTTFAAALAAFYPRIPVAHVEAGLRTGNKYSPFPEEINRRVTTHLADYHFAPTDVSRDNLLREGIYSSNVLVTGNTVIDALLYVRSRLARDPCLAGGLDLASLNGNRLILVTAHRRENFGIQMRQICEAIRELAQSRDDVTVIYPVHLNPNVAGPVHSLLGGIPNIQLLGPLDYVSFVALMERAQILLTDSGGIQEEGPALGKPVLVMRDTSERPEAITAGTARLVGTDSSQIISAVTTLLDDPQQYRAMVQRTNPYGDGNASKRIVEFLTQKLWKESRAAGVGAGSLAH